MDIADVGEFAGLVSEASTMVTSGITTEMQENTEKLLEPLTKLANAGDEAITTAVIEGGDAEVKVAADDAISEMDPELQKYHQWVADLEGIANQEVKDQMARLLKHGQFAALEIHMKGEWQVKLMEAKRLEAENALKATEEAKMSQEVLATKNAIIGVSMMGVVESRLEVEMDITKKFVEVFGTITKLFARLGASATSYVNKTISYRRRQYGGVIDEPVVGIGQNSGDLWTFGERGREMVTPMGGVNNNSTSNSQVVNVNINIDKMSKDVDLLQIKPIIERVLHESHSRRGII